MSIEREFPEGYKDALLSDTTIVFGWWDRVRILFGWNFVCHTATLCENPPGKNEHWPRYSHIHVTKPKWWPKRKRVAYVVEASQPRAAQEKGGEL